VSSIRLAQAGICVTLYEKKAYPFHRVCGEYISNEVLPFLESLQINVQHLQPAKIEQFLLSSPSGQELTLPLDLGGFGVSRYALDAYLVQLARAAGVTVVEKTQVQEVTFQNYIFSVQLANGTVTEADLVVGSYGKRSHLDRKLNRAFFAQSSPYLGVKYHVKTDMPRNLIALHNFKDGYAGISAIEEDKFCFCYLTTRANLKVAGSIAQMEKQVLAQNPALRKILNTAEFLWPQPEVINEISFASKTCVENHVLLCGDAAGMITPLCGNGMAMAIHAAKILTDVILRFRNGTYTRTELENMYTQQWQRLFSRRLWIGRTVQQLFGRPLLTEMVVSTFKQLPAGVRFLMKRTHGEPF
jgi:flavin-dependent dehydrogenase